MKVLNVYGVLCLILVLCICACDSEMIGVEENAKIAQRKSSEFYCEKENDCVPEVVIHGDNESVEISQYGNSASDHLCLLQCEGANGFIYKKEIVGNNGNWRIPLPDIKAYTIEYTITCQEAMLICQNGCKRSGMFWKKADESYGSMAGVNECFKEYYDYNIEQDGLTGVITMKRGVNYSDDSNYMDIDKITIYKQVPQTMDKWIKIHSEPLTSIEEGVFRLPDLPCDMKTNYQARLTSSVCKNSINEHYLYFSYYSINGSPMIMSLERVNNH